MCVFKNHAFIYFLRPPSWSGTIIHYYVLCILIHVTYLWYLIMNYVFLIHCYVQYSVFLINATYSQHLVTKKAKAPSAKEKKARIRAFCLCRAPHWKHSSRARQGQLRGRDVGLGKIYHWLHNTLGWGRSHLIKGTVAWDFLVSFFFHETTPNRPMMNVK
jgi:hypothetical protein